MAIDFSNGDIVIPNRPYVSNSLPGIATQFHLKQSLITLRNLLGVPSTVINTGNLSFPSRSFIHVRPINSNNIAYRGGRGVVLYFSNDAQLNNAFETSQAFLIDKCTIKAVNNTGSLIPKNSVVRQSGFDATLQVPEISLADATTSTNAVVFGVAREDIANGSCGGILVDGSYQEDTSSFSVGAPVYVSDTPGNIATSAGTIETIIGRVLSVGTTGTVSVFSVITGGSGGGGGGGGGGFFTDGTGTNAAIGKGDIAPIAAGENGFAHGDNVSIDADCDNSFAHGENIDLVTGSTPNAIMAQGANIDFSGYESHFLQGKALYFENDSGTGGGANLMQGFLLRAYDVGYGNLIQGIGMSDLDFHGGSFNLVQGSDIDIGDSGSDGIFRCLIQGEDHAVDSGGANNLVQGNNHSFGTDVRNSFAQGNDNTIDASYSFAQGYGCNIASTAAYSFAQGYNNSVDNARGFALGAYTRATRSDQKAWGSNRADNRGDAQCSKIIKYVDTSDATPTTLVTLDTENNKAYSISAHVVAKSRTVGGQAASFVLTQAICVNDNGSVSLTGSPISLTKAETAAVTWTATLSVSGSDILLRVVGAAASNIDWCCSFDFVEVNADAIV